MVPKIPFLFSIPETVKNKNYVVCVRRPIFLIYSKDKWHLSIGLWIRLLSFLTGRCFWANEIEIWMTAQIYHNFGSSDRITKWQIYSRKIIDISRHDYMTWIIKFYPSLTIVQLYRELSWNVLLRDIYRFKIITVFMTNQ